MTLVDAARPTPAPSNVAAIVLLAAQAFALGLMVAWVTIAASAIFLDTYGSGALPATYLGAAAAGALASAALTKAFRRRSLVWVAMRVLAGLAVVFCASFVLLWKSGPATSVALLVLIPILVPVGFMFVVGQAGMLLDVRALKALYARVIAGFALGFVVGGVGAPAMITVFGRTEVLLALAAAVAMVFLLLVWRTERRFPAALAVVETTAADMPRPTVKSLLRDRYVVLIVAFQMLSAVESQWLDYLVFDRAAQRYTTSEQLAEFIGKFTAIAYGTDIVFLLIFAGVLLRRFGLRYGLTANAVVVLMLVVATIVAGSVQGTATTLVFVLVVASRVSDLTLSDATSRTSLSAAYQAVPTPQRLAAQATVEGLAVPVAIGASGLMLMVLRATLGTNGVALPVATSVVVAAWLVVAVGVYRGYRVNLLANLRHRSLDPATITIDDEATLAAIDRLIDSSDEREVRLGLQTLAAADHPGLIGRLEQMATDDRFGLRSYALERLEQLNASRAVTAARLGTQHGTPANRAASLRTLAATAGVEDLALFVALWADPDPDVRLAAAAGIARLGDETDRLDLSEEIAHLACVEGRDAPIFAARVLAVCGPGAGIDRGPLKTLLTNPDHQVVEAALVAIRWPDDELLLPQIALHLEDRRSSAATVDALAGGGGAVLQFIHEGLSGLHGLTSHGQRQLTRVARMMGPEAVVVLRRHVGHRDREIGRGVLRVLADLMSVPSPELGPVAVGAVSFPDALDAVIRDDLNLAAHSLRAMSALPDSSAFANLHRALLDELQLAQQRVHACLCVRYGAEEMNVVAFQLAQPDTRSHALAIEWLDVTLTGVACGVVPLIEPGLLPADRFRALGRWAPLPPASLTAVLADIIADPDDRWRRPWLTACALLAAADSNDEALMALVHARSVVHGELHRELFRDDTSIVDETLDAILAHPRYR